MMQIHTYLPTEVHQIVAAIRAKSADRGYSTLVYYYISGVREGKITISRYHIRQTKESSISKSRVLVGTYKGTVTIKELKEDIKFIAGGDSNETISKPVLPNGVHGGTCYGRSGYLSI